MDLPFVSVVVCAHNEEALLKRCLEGLRTQTYPARLYEVVIIDDESTDATFSIAETFIRSLPSEGTAFHLATIERGGLSIARNAGIQLSQGEIIAFTDGDAIAYPDWLERLIAPFMGQADFVGGKIELLNAESWVAHFLQLTRHRQEFGPSVFSNDLIGCNMAFRKGVFDFAGGFYESFDRRGDESSLRRRLEPQFTYAPAPDATVRHERPDSLMAALRTEWLSALLRPLVLQAGDHAISWKRLIAYAEMFCIAGLPLWFLLLGAAPLAAAGLLMITGVAFVRRLAGRRLSRSIFKDLAQSFGTAKALLMSACYLYLHSSIHLFGSLVGYWTYRRTKLVKPLTTPLKIKRRLSNFDLLSSDR